MVDGVLEWLGVVLRSVSGIMVDTASLHRMDLKSEASYPDCFLSLGTNSMEIEFTQCRVFFIVSPSHIKTCPR